MNERFKTSPKTETETRRTFETIQERLPLRQEFTLPHETPANFGEVEANLEALITALRNAGVLTQ